MNDSVNGSTIAHTIVRANGSTNDYNSSTADLQQLYGGSTAAHSDLNDKTILENKFVILH